MNQQVPNFIEINIQNKYKVIFYPKQKVFDLIEFDSKELNEFDSKELESKLLLSQKYSSYMTESTDLESQSFGTLLIHIKDDVYYLITSFIFRLKYEYEIQKIIFENCIISIFSTKGLLTIVKDQHNNYFCVEIESYFEKRNKDIKIAKILSEKKHRYIPCLEISDF